MPDTSLHRFGGKTVIVTGAGSGIGAATARRFHDEGANVVLAGRHKDKLKDIAIDFDPARTLVQPCDVSSEKDVAKLIAVTLRKFGGLDVLVNNAGIAIEGKVSDLSAQQWREQMGTNLDGVFYCSKAALPHLVERRGCIVNTASVSGLGGDDGTAAYNAAKGGVVNLTRCMAIDHGRDGVRVNAVCPSLTETPMTEDMMADRKTVKAFKNRMPLGGPAQPEDVSGVIAFLASEDASFVTGVNLPVDGGVGASNGQPIYYH